MVRDKKGGLLFLVVPDLPKDLRRPLLHHLELVFQDSLNHTDSRNSGINGSFDALHFSFYNRYSSNVRVSFFRFVYFP